MDVRCPKCGSLYELDERRMRGAQATLQCSVCSHLFRVRAAAPALSITAQRWMIRSHTTGDVRYVQDFQEVHQLLMRRKVLPDDFISRTGRRWTRLSDMGELMPVFQTLESISLIEQSRGEVSGMGLGRADTSSMGLGARGDISGLGLGYNSSSYAEVHTRQPMATMQQFALDPPPPGMMSGEWAASAPSGEWGLPEISDPYMSAPDPGLLGRSGSFARADGYRPDASSAPFMEAPALPQAPPLPAAMQQPAPVTSLQTSPEEPPDADDAKSWVMGSQVPVIADDPATRSANLSGSFARAPRQEVSGSRRTTVILGVLLLGSVLLVGGGIWAARSGMLGGVKTTSVTDGPEALAIARASEKLAQAELAARAAVDAQVILRVESAHGEAQDVTERAVTAAQDALPRKPVRRAPSTRTMLRRAKLALRRGETDEAVELFDKIIERSPTNAEAISGKGWARLRDNRHAEALKLFEEALNHDAKLADAYIGLGSAARYLKRKDQAINAYEEYLRRFPDGRDANGARYQLKNLKGG